MIPCLNKISNTTLSKITPLSFARNSIFSFFRNPPQSLSLKHPQPSQLTRLYWTQSNKMRHFSLFSRRFRIVWPYFSNNSKIRNSKNCTNTSARFASCPLMSTKFTTFLKISMKRISIRWPKSIQVPNVFCVMD